jgi:uridine kinase
VPPADVVIIEGILVLHMEEIRSLLNMKVYVDTDDDVRLARRCGGAAAGRCCLCCLCCLARCVHAVLQAQKRPHYSAEPCSVLYPVFPALCRIQRDVAVRGRDVGGVIEQYTKFVKPAFDQFVAPSRKFADIIVPWQRCDEA